MKVSCPRCLIDSCDHRSVSSKYSPLPWEGHFDEELKVAIPDSDDVSISFKIFLTISDCWNLFKMLRFISPYNLYLIDYSSLTRPLLDWDFLRWMMPCGYFVYLEPSFLLQNTRFLPSHALSIIEPLSFWVYWQVFHLYLAGSEGPVVFCLHGGGYTG